METPVSKLLEGDFAAVSARLADDKARELLFVWICLLFLKVHLKDANVPIHLDRRLGGERIGDDYDWADLHHIHQVARSPYTKASLMPAVIGSLQVFEIATTLIEDDYDYLDFTDAQTLMVRVGRIGIVATLNDSKASESAWSDRLDLIAGPINDLQLREVAAMFAQANRDLIGRPLFSTFVLYGKFAMIVAQRQPLQLRPFDPATFGPTLAHAGHSYPRARALMY